MQKNRISQPIVIYMYGIPGSGKTFVARQLSENLGMAHISGDRIIHELFEHPKHDKTERQIVMQMMNFMTEQFLQAGVSVIYDISVSRLAERRQLRDLARKFHAKELMLWLQIDVDSAWARTQSRDKRKADDKYSPTLDNSIFDSQLRMMQNPNNEEYLVLSGKHLYNSHKVAVFRRLEELGVLTQESIDTKVAKPELVNLVSRAQAQAGRVDYSRRNIVIR